jgi:hypothetical protein
MSIDKRIVRVSITIDNITTWYENLWIEAKGTKVSSSISANCDITILGLSSETRNFILRETRPLTPNAKRVLVELQVGRESYGASTYYSGYVFRSEATPKPNLGVMLKCIVGANNKNKMVQNTAGELTKLSAIAKTVAQNNDLSLNFQTTDKNIRSYSFTGSADAAIKNLEQIANVEVFVDSGILYVKDQGDAASTRVSYDVNDSLNNLISSTGTESGVKVRTMFNPNINIGSIINLDSKLNPQLTGSYVLYKVEFHITSRAQPFYLDIEGNLQND